MLRVQESPSRQVKTLNGTWDFFVDSDNSGFERELYAGKLPTAVKMAVPASYNDVLIDTDIHDHVGYVWYQRSAYAPQYGADRLFIRFGSVTHAAVVWVNGVEVVRHVGGYLPFEADITELVKPGEQFTVTVCADNRLSWQTIPPGYVTQNSAGKDVQHYFHDFYNYAGIHRTVCLYTRPEAAVTDVTITTDIDGTTGVVNYDVTAGADVVVKVLDPAGTEVANGVGASGTLRIDNADFWAPGHGALYTLEIQAGADLYPQRFGIRTVTIDDGVFMINGKPFYFRGYGRHEDNPIRGKQHDDVAMINDFDIMRWQGANSFRTSHYPYAEEVMDYADEQGWVVIDETPAVGLNMGLSGGIFNAQSFITYSDETVNAATQEAHAREIRDLIARDKNHPCVVIWSIANEPETNTEASRAYFEPLAQVAREADPTRPVGYVNVMLSTPDVEQITDLFDVIMLNRYYGWYVNTGELADAEAALRAEIDQWIADYPGKPIIFTEFGPDTLNGNKDFFRRPWSEEFQEDNIGMFMRVFDDYPQIQGEQMWNFADFQTTPGIMRVAGNKKGMFTRDRQPKLNAYTVRERWLRLKQEQGW
ncbi:beta-glucuronidase [Trueperella pyogenes]|uniref:Beta-glucuronidase n=1 Tax=Trueperella pyogenes TaxID=1661 RepID=A0A3S9QP01_9ACTO|nr:beta-glucuronidase [Trueperella pyogenes]AWG03032.1 beta-glucuronidase [Trueperella pyogenes]AWG15760.1 beta-glucuronidase [Trueperella pyogenes]AZR04645.1 beta-glucuronidase [Trueperella pyogenes]AZR07713.1 beta-glucuronidase [Trueperella pyogenes]MCI7690106.1 beta-glucuronidase [Trueperella pyogenes]